MDRPFKIRGEQMQEMDRVTEEQFVEKVIANLKSNHADSVQDLPDDVLRERVKRGIVRARGHGLTWERSIYVFVSLMFIVAPNFDEFPPVRACLSDPSRPPDQRVDSMMDTITPQQWASAQERG